MMHTRVNYFKRDQELIIKLGETIMHALYEAIENKGHASLVVSGGNTPKALFAHLSQQKFPWAKVSITLADDRCLNVRQSDSNANLIKTHFLQNAATEATFIPLYSDEDNADQAASNASKKLERFKEYDMLILGLGTDGHTASLFPEASNLQLALSDDAPHCLPIDPVTNDMMRVTQSLNKLMSAHQIAFHIVGAEKNDILNKVLDDKEKKLYPSSHFIHQDKVPVEIFYAQDKS